jgi:hypothetical protein
MYLTCSLCDPRCRSQKEIPKLMLYRFTGGCYTCKCQVQEGSPMVRRWIKCTAVEDAYSLTYNP